MAGVCDNGGETKAGETATGDILPLPSYLGIVAARTCLFRGRLDWNSDAVINCGGGASRIYADC